jgi:Spy/CpxP family protein refolding chaperone
MALWKHAVVSVAALAITGSVLSVVRAEDAATPPAVEAKAEKKAEKKAVRLFKPYSELTGLTDEQRQEIVAIRKKYNDEIKALKEKEKAELTAVLTDDQKAEITRLEETEAANRKKGKQAKEMPTTAPAQ